MAEKQEQGDQVELEIASTENYVKGLDEGIAYFDKELKEWREATRKSFEGYKIGKLSTVSGKNYSAAVIVKIVDEAVTISDAGSEVTIAFNELSEALRVQLVHEPTILTKRGIK